VKVFVSGASGFIGARCAAVLDAHGHRVVGLSRRPAPSSSSVEWVQGDLSGPADIAERLAPTLADCDAVVHLVGIATEVPSQGQTFEAVHRGGTENLLRALRLSGTEGARFVYVSAVGAAPNAPSHYARSKAAAEAAVRDSWLSWTILRPSLVLGSGADFLERLKGLVTRPPLSPLPLPFVPVPGDGATRFQPVFVDDLAQCIVRALETQEAAGKTLEVGGADVVTLDEIVRAVQEALGAGHKPRWHVPRPLLFCAAAALEALVPRPPITADQVCVLGSDSVCDTEGMQHILGVTPLGFGEALARSLSAASETPAAAAAPSEAGASEV
jgi:Nucleoside-diphosphate-sugar epimerases